jgi:hypothetical protein
MGGYGRLWEGKGGLEIHDSIQISEAFLEFWKDSARKILFFPEGS